MVVVYPTISTDINDLFILRSRVFGSVERLDAVVYASELSRFVSNNLLLYTHMENCGAGNAINVKIKYDENELTTLCISTSTPKSILFVLKDELFCDKTEECIKMDFSFEYTDVSSLGQYKQTESFVFGRNTSNELYVSQMKDDLLSAPEEIL